MTGPVMLVYPYFRHRDPVQKLFPPLGLLALAGQLKAEGVSVQTCDCTFLSFPQAVERIATTRPTIIGMYVMVTLTRNAYDLVQALRVRLVDTLFVAGGPLPTVYPDRFIPLFDVIFRGESDLTFPRFCRDYLQGGDDLDHLDLTRYPGIYYRDRDTLISQPIVHHPASILDSLPLSDRGDIDHKRYQQFWMEHAGCKMTSIFITRGCPFTCDFCSKPVWGSLYRKPPLDRVFREIEEIDRLGYNRLWIADDSFTLDLSYLRTFCEEMISQQQPLTWICLSRVDRLDSDLIALMREAGCVGVFLGLESGSDETLRLMGKRTTVAEGEKAVHLFHDAGISVSGFFLVGYPGESVTSIEQTFAHALSLPLQEISLNIPYPLPGSLLFERVAEVESRDWEVAGEISFLYRTEFDESWLRERIASTLEHFRQQKEAQAVGGIAPNPGPEDSCKPQMKRK
ncbi:MAG: B12-binding domain-containing radical SAM protein [Methanomicrobiales archaeon]|nr:B12-binding domain-containing radical SAM protein [Methanomicrobiales archaeon]